MEKKLDLPEQIFAQALRRGQLHGFEYFFDKYSRVLFQFANNLLKSSAEAEEIVQNVFLKVWEKRSQIDIDQPFRPYLFTIALNDIRKSFIEKAKHDRFKVELFDFLVEQRTEDMEEYNFAEYLRLLDEAIEQLPEKRKAIFLLLKKEGLTVNEVASYLKISPKTVENQLTKALKTIRTTFQENHVTGLYLFFVHLLEKHKQASSRDRVH